MRNQLMLECGEPDLVLAFRMPGKSAGTDDMVRRARKADIETHVFEGSGPPKTFPVPEIEF